MSVKLSLVIPLYNEADHLEDVLARLDSVIQELAMPCELILVDDGSQDATWVKIKEGAKQFSYIRGLRFSRNFGKESALAAGLEVSSGDAAVIMDGDLQHPPELIHQMVDLWKKGDVDIVEAVKAARPSEPWWVRAGAHLFYALHQRTSGTTLEGATDYKLLDRRAIDAWKRMGERNIFFRGMAAWIGFRRQTIPFNVPERVGGTSRWRFVQLLRLAITGITSFTSLPLHLTTLIGILFFLFSLILGSHTLFMKFTGQAVSGFATVILLLLITGSCILVSIGIVGIYIARIYEEVKARPRFLISEDVKGVS